MGFQTDGGWRDFTIHRINKPVVPPMIPPMRAPTNAQNGNEKDKITSRSSASKIRMTDNTAAPTTTPKHPPAQPY
jgi:hypothetical protein